MAYIKDTFKVMTFNLRKDSWFDRQNRWSNRKDMVIDFIKNSNASIVGVQELLPHMKKDIEEKLEGFSLFGTGRSKKFCNEHSDVIVANDDVQVDFSKTIWLSKSPEKLGSRAFMAFFPRICTICEVTFKNTGGKVRVYNAHFDHISGFARALSVKIIWEYMDKFQTENPMPTILMGDFNVSPKNRIISQLRGNHHNYDGIELKDAYYEKNKVNGKYNTYHGFTGRVHGSRQLDYIFVSSDLEVVNVKIDRTEQNGKFLSDHYPIIAELKFKDCVK